MSGNSPYGGLADIYDKWNADHDYAGWVDFLERRWQTMSRPVKSVLELCCGTGTVLQHLVRRGYSVWGVDASPEMLTHARGKLGPLVPAVCAELPHVPFDGPFDSVVCVYDSINYVAGIDAIDATFAEVRRVLRPDGLFVFDVITPRRFRRLHGAAFDRDLGDFSYLWEGQLHVDEQYFDFQVAIRLLGSEGSPASYVEHHRQYLYTRQALNASALRTTFRVVGVFDDYHDTAAEPTTERETWVLTPQAP